MQLTCPTCGARYRVADGMIAPGGQHVQCTNCHARWFERPPADEADASFGEDEIIARLDRRAGATGTSPRAARRSQSSGTPGSGEDTEFLWEGRGDAAAGPRPAARSQPGHLRLVKGEAGAGEADEDAAAQPATDPDAAARPATDPDAASQPATDPDAAARPATEPDAAARPATDPAPRPMPAATPPAGARDAAPVSQPVAAGGVAQPGIRHPARPRGAGEADLDPADAAKPADAAAPPADLRPARPPAQRAAPGRLDLGASGRAEPAPPRRRRWTGGLLVGLALVVLLIALYLAVDAGIFPWAVGPIAA